MISRFFIIIFLFLAPPLSAATYYLDSSRPNDSGNGLSPAAAKKTIAVATALVHDGDTLRFAKGSEWFGRVVLGKNNVTYNTYGAGAAPVIRWDIVLTSGAWTGPDANGCYTHATAYTEAVSEDGLVIPFGSTAAIPEGPGHWFWNKSTTLYYKPTAGVPSAHVVTTIQGVAAGVMYNESPISGNVIDGLHFKFAGFNDAYGLVTSITFQNCIFDQICGHGIWISNHGHCFISPSVRILSNTFTACENNIYLVSPNRKIWWLNGIEGGTIQEPKAVEGMTSANPCMVTISGHGLSNGMSVGFQGIAQDAGSWKTLNGHGYIIGNVTTNTFTLTGADTSTFPAYVPATGRGKAFNGYMQGSFQGAEIRNNIITKSNQFMDGVTAWDPKSEGDLDGMALQCLKDAIIEHNVISGRCSNAIGGSGAISYWTCDSVPPTADTTGNIIRYNYIHDVQGEGIIYGGADFPPNVNCRIYGNIIANAARCGLVLDRPQAISAPSEVYSNTMYNCGTGILAGVMFARYNVRDNILVSCAKQIACANSPAEFNTYKRGAYSSQFDHNTFYGPGADHFQSYATPKTYAQWKAIYPVSGIKEEQK